MAFYQSPAIWHPQIVYGGTFKKVFTHRNRLTGAAIDLTDVASVDAQIKDFGGSVLLAITASVLGTPTNGQIELTATKTATGAIVLPTYATELRRWMALGAFDCKLNWTTGSEVDFIMVGTANICRTNG